MQVMALGPVPGQRRWRSRWRCSSSSASRPCGGAQTAVARGLSPFVGRQAELETLRQALTRAGAGQGQVVASASPA